jgi:hypothetical protein
MSDWSSRNAFKPYKPGNDFIVLERGGDLVVRKRWRRRKVIASPLLLKGR